MKKKLLFGFGFALVITLGLLVWYFTSPSASQAAMYSELDKLQVNTTARNNQEYRSGSCFDTCATAGLIAMIPKTSDYDALYETYREKLSQNGYNITTTQEEFTSPTYSNGNPSSRYLVINAEGENKYQLRITFQNQSAEPSMTNPSGEPVYDVFMAIYGLTASTR